MGRSGKTASVTLPLQFEIRQKTRGAPKIWMTKADFDAKAAEFGKVVAENHEKAKGSLEGLRVAIPAIGNVCDGCHKDYRLPRQ